MPVLCRAMLRTAQDYFREVTRQDVANLLSFVVDPDDDGALLVPQLGRPVREPLPACARPHPPTPAAGRGVAGQQGQEDDDGGEVGTCADVVLGLCAGVVGLEGGGWTRTLTGRC